MTMKVERVVSMLDIQELVAHILGVSGKYEEGEIDDDDLEQLLYDELELSMEQVEIMVNLLLPMAMCAKSELTGKTVQGFAIIAEKYSTFLCKAELVMPVAVTGKP